MLYGIQALHIGMIIQDKCIKTYCAFVIKIFHLSFAWHAKKKSGKTKKNIYFATCKKACFELFKYFK